jgi:hypothetical protein
VSRRRRELPGCERAVDKLAEIDAKLADLAVIRATLADRGRRL